MRLKQWVTCISLVLLFSAPLYGQNLPKVRAAYTSIGIQFDRVYIMKELDLPRKYGLDVDVLFVGPSDLTVSMGIFRQFQHEKYQKAIRDVAAAAKKYNKCAGVLLQDPSEYEMYYKLGYRFLACGSDGSFVHKAAADMVKKLGDLASSMKKS